MTTPYANEQLSAYLDGELTDAEQRELEALLEQDASLRSELEALERATDFFRTHAPRKAPTDFASKVTELALAEPLPANNANWWRRPFGVPIEGVAVAAAALLVLGVTLNLGGSAGGDQTVRTDAGAAMAPADKGGDLAKADAKGNKKNASKPQTVASASGGVEDKLQGDLAKSAYDLGEKALSKSLGGSEDGADAEVAQADGGAMDPAAGAAPAGTDSENGDTKMGAMYSYVVTTDDPEVMVGLMRAAAKYNGKLEDTSGHSVDATAMDTKTDATFQVHLPPRSLAEFGDALHSLGKVEQVPSNKWYGSSVATVQVQVKVLGADELNKKALPRGTGSPSY